MNKPISPFILHTSSIILFLALLLLFAFLVPLPIPAYLDFQVLYHANLGLTQDIALYDRAAQAEMIARLAGVTADQVFILPFPYPPWYALATLFLAWPPVEVAARLWFGLNLSMLLASVWLLTDGWKPVPRLASFLAAIVFIPIIGSLYVGQFIFPVLLGASLITFALRRENISLTALAAALLTFKPHLGGPLAVAALIYLLLRRDDFSRRAVRAILVTAVFLFAIGFLADPAWPINYLHSLLGFRDIPGVSSCGLCASLPVGLVALLTGQTDIGPALPLGLALFVILFVALIRFRREIFQTPESLVSASILITLLADPYLLNYDFALLLVPLFILASSASGKNWLWLVFAYLFPSLLLGLFGRGGNLYLSIAALLLLSLQIARAKPIDGSPREA
ncbi:MAG: DUF2029 domain-containing protein [Anaerolineaceae bacterium]|nr:MAG: DUF2029 domain-containing protein [Anaerolineaceae bacterium]